MFFCCPFSCTGKHDGSISYNNMERELCQPEQREFSEFKGNYSTAGEDFFPAEKPVMHQAYRTIKLSQFQPFFSIQIYFLYGQESNFIRDVQCHRFRFVPAFGHVIL